MTLATQIAPPVPTVEVVPGVHLPVETAAALPHMYIAGFGLVVKLTQPPCPQCGGPRAIFATESGQPLTAGDCPVCTATAAVADSSYSWRLISEHDPVLGAIRVDCGGLPALGAFLAALTRHAANDHGEFGQCDSESVTPETQFAPALASIAARNALALADGRGAVRSRYPVPTELHEHLNNGHYLVSPDRSRRAMACIDIVSLIGSPSATYVGAVSGLDARRSGGRRANPLGIALVPGGFFTTCRTTCEHGILWPKNG